MIAGVFLARLDLTKDAYEVAVSGNNENAAPTPRHDLPATTLPIASSQSTSESQQHRRDVVQGNGPTGGQSHERTSHLLRQPHFASPSSTDAAVLTQPHASRKSNASTENDGGALIGAIDSLFGSEAWLAGRHFRNR